MTRCRSYLQNALEYKAKVVVQKSSDMPGQATFNQQ